MAGPEPLAGSAEEPDARRPLFEGLVAVLLLSVMDAVIKSLVATLPVAEVALIRYVVGSVMMTTIVAVARPGWPRSDTVRANSLRAILVVVTATTFFYALSALPLAETLILSFVSPAFTALLAVLLLGERVNGRVATALAAGFGGVLVIVSGDRGPFGGGDPAASERPLLGIAAVLVSAFTYAASNVLLRARAQRDPVLLIVLIQNVAPACILAIPAVIVWRTPEGSELWRLLAVGLLGVGGHLMMARAYAGAQATRLASLDYTALIWAVLIGFAAFSEVPTIWALLGAALILSGAYLGSRR